MVVGPQMGPFAQASDDGWDDNGSTLRNTWPSAPLPSTNPRRNIQGLNPLTPGPSFNVYLLVTFEFC